MDYQLSEDQKLIVENVRRFVKKEILPLEEKLDPDAGEVSPEDKERLVSITREMGLFGLGIPPEFGGPDIDVTTQTLITLEISQHRAGLYNPAFGAFGGAGLAQLFEATEQQKEKYLFPVLRGEKTSFFGLTEPSGGSDPGRAIQTRGVQDGDDWILNGAKIFISGADQADFGILFARTSEDKGRNGITCFLIDSDMPGFNVRRVVHTLRSTKYATEIQIEDLRVPKENILGEVNKGFAIASDRLARQRIPYAAGCIGVAIKAQEMAIEYCKIRETFGGLLSTRQAVQWMIVDNEIDIRTSKHICLDAAQKADRGEDFRTEAAMAKLLGSEAGGRVVDRSMQIHGGYGMTKDLPLERWYREMRIRRIGEGPSEVQRLVMARNLIGGSFH
ncbi:MAG: acyl-CoA dehydrogenase family protein [Pseudomonadales bacterium]|nr:acyl-CoA dehydrogenase family protein [Pseudomonadales bacterium]